MQATIIVISGGQGSGKSTLMEGFKSGYTPDEILHFFGDTLAEGQEMQFTPELNKLVIFDEIPSLNHVDNIINQVKQNECSCIGCGRNHVMFILATQEPIEAVEGLFSVLKLKR